MSTGVRSVAADRVGWLTRDQMVEVDRIMVEDLRILLLQMMENAGRGLATLVMQRFAPERVIVLAGPGGNGGGGLVAARHLANRGVMVEVVLGTEEGRFAPVPAHQLDVVQRMGLPVVPEPSQPGDVVIDALIGYSLRGAPRGRAEELIVGLGRFGGAVVALDTPSGVDVTDGSTPGVAVRADATVTLALPKIGLRGHPLVGELYLADISVPPSVYDRFGVAAPDFGPSPIHQIV
jgi:NAD(P)H-hydrate epimerase